MLIQVVYPQQYNWPFNDNDWYIILNLAITSSGPNSNTFFPSQIKWIGLEYVVNTGNILGCTTS